MKNVTIRGRLLSWVRLKNWDIEIFNIFTLNSTCSLRSLYQGRKCKQTHIIEATAPVTQTNAIMGKIEVIFANKKHPHAVKTYIKPQNFKPKRSYTLCKFFLFLVFSTESTYNFLCLYILKPRTQHQMERI